MKDHSLSFKNNRFLYRVKKTIHSFEMVQPGDAVLVGVSGGPDSVALLYALHWLTADLSITLGAGHVNHCLRGNDSDNDAAFVSSLCGRLDIPCYTLKENVNTYKTKHGLSLEEASRRVRYNFYLETAAAHGFNRIALGHHQDDNAELILMHLFRGSGPRGLSGIPPIRNHQHTDVKIIRPFMEVTRTQIIEFLKTNNFQYVTDNSNLDTSFLRNKIRYDLLPMLKATYNPRITATLNRLASIIRSEETWIDHMAQSLFDTAAAPDPDGRIKIFASKFSALPIAAQRRMIRMAIGRIKGNTRRITLAHIDAILSLLKDPPETGSLDLPDRIRVIKDKDMLWIVQEKKSLRDVRFNRTGGPSVPYEYTIRDPNSADESSDQPKSRDPLDPNIQNAPIFIKEIDAYMRIETMSIKDLPDIKQPASNTAFLDYDKLRFPLVLRNAMPGDRFTPLGMSGSQKVMKFFKNQKVQNRSRGTIPLLLSQEKIVWVVGHRIDNAFKVIPATQNVLKAELFLA